MAEMAIKETVPDYRVFDVLMDPVNDHAIFESNNMDEVVEWFEDVHPGFINSYYILDKNNNKVHLPR